MSEKTSYTQVQEFYKNQTIFITGGSGFMGKVLIEKLLRTCGDLTKIFLLMRYKKNKTPTERLEKILNLQCFEKLKKLKPDVFNKITVIYGDCCELKLGLSDEDLKIIKEETTCVIHAAASVRFDQPLKQATKYVLGTRELLNIGKEMRKLKCFVFVSTAYSNCIYPKIDEEFYTSPIKAEDLFQLVNIIDEKTLNKITPELLGDFPNTYVYTKCVSEDLVKSYGKDLPITVVRPSIIMSSYKEPLPGWVDKVIGPYSVAALVATGVIHVLYANKHKIPAEIPVDFVVNCVLAAAWKRTNLTETLIFNAVGNKQYQINFENKFKQCISCYKKNPSVRSVWYPSVILSSNKHLVNFCGLLFHQIPAHIADFILLCLGKETKFVNFLKKTDEIVSSLSFFLLRDWDFGTKNVDNLWNELSNEDKDLFNYSMEYFPFYQHTLDTVDVAKVTVLRDTKSVDQAKRKLKLLCVLNYTVIFLFWYLIYKVVMLIFNIFM